MKKVDSFLAENKLRAHDVDMEQLVSLFHSEMDKGLKGETSSLRMIPTYIEADNEFLKDTPVLAIDAGGTNFRTTLVTFRKDGALEMEPIKNFRMPGIEEEVSKAEFFEIMAGFIKPFASETGRIGFCFSYPTEIFPNKDGRLLQFCKEIQAPQVVGQIIGRSLLEALGTPDKKIVLLNDTVATLLAGKSASFSKAYDSYIGFILGTGTNTCYIEANRNIPKTPGLESHKSMIINIESGNFNLAPRSVLDIKFDNTTMNPGNYSFEKMFSGGYFGGLCLTVLKEAASFGVFSDGPAGKLNQIRDLTAEAANRFLTEDSGDNILDSCFLEAADRDAAKKIISCLIDRASKLVASNLAAAVLKTGKGIDPAHPVLMTIEGTTFYKLKNLRERFEEYLSGYLSGEKKRYVEFTEVAQSSLIGAALAGLID